MLLVRAMAGRSAAEVAQGPQAKHGQPDEAGMATGAARIACQTSLRTVLHV